VKPAIICGLVVLVVAAVVWAATPDEADYPVQYEVMNTSTVGSWMIGNFCTMSLRDRANAGMAFIVQRRGHGSCHVWDSGTVLHGRREKNEIRLLVRDDKGKLKVEHWPIAGTVALK
jgi:hypothetical protein